MNGVKAAELVSMFAECQACGSSDVNNGEGGISITDDTFKRDCKCGWSIQVKENTPVHHSVYAKNKQMKEALEKIANSYGNVHNDHQSKCIAVEAMQTARRTLDNVNKRVIYLGEVKTYEDLVKACSKLLKYDFTENAAYEFLENHTDWAPDSIQYAIGDALKNIDEGK